jgi:hypothetical protein
MGAGRKMLNKKLVVIFLMTIFISACGNNKEFKMTNKNTRIYHLAAVDIVPVIGPILSPFNPHTIRYVGKLEVDEETKGIKYYFLNLADEKRLSSVFTLYKNEEERLFYIDYSNKKLTKISESEEIDYMQYMNLWVRTGEVTFSDPNFWNIFEKYGIKTKISNTQTVT